jgi:hypothetical protein
MQKKKPYTTPMLTQHGSAVTMTAGEAGRSLELITSGRASVPQAGRSQVRDGQDAGKGRGRRRMR